MVNPKIVIDLILIISWDIDNLIQHQYQKHKKLAMVPISYKNIDVIGQLY